MRSFIPFNVPADTGHELAFVRRALKRKELVAGLFLEQCKQWLEQTLPGPAIYLTPSCTHALEMAALLLDIQPGDEIIMPSYTFVSAANAFVLRGGVPVFIDIRPDTMNIDESLVEHAISSRTRAIMAMHYGGIACDMQSICRIAAEHAIPVIEDAAHALTAQWQGKPLGTFGAIGVFSFHQTKNFTAGEGGAIVLNDPAYIERAKILRHKGTNRDAFSQGAVNFYEWMDVGSSWIMNELNAAYLYGNLISAENILRKRHDIWKLYIHSLRPLEEKGFISLPSVPEGCAHNAHLFYLKVSDAATRDDFLAYMRNKRISAVFHYVPLHSAPAGKRYGRFEGEDRFTTKESQRLVRLPLFYNMTLAQTKRVIAAIHDYYG